MKKRDDAVYVQDVLDAIHQIETYLAGLSYDDFLGNRLVQDGVAHQLEIIGEASRNLSQGFRDRYLGLPWQDIIGMRNRIAHAYFAIDLRSVWDTARLDLPIVKAWGERILSGEDPWPPF